MQNIRNISANCHLLTLHRKRWGYHTYSKILINQFYYLLMCLSTAQWLTISADWPHPYFAASDLGLQFLLRIVCPNTVLTMTMLLILPTTKIPVCNHSYADEFLWRTAKPLMLGTLGTIFSRRQIFFLFSPRKQDLIFHVNCLLSQKTGYKLSWKLSQKTGSKL